MSDRVISRKGIAIRLTDERWSHIIEEHAELAGMRRDVLEAVSDPERVFQGNHGALMAARVIEAGKFLVVVYTERGDDGFVITAFLTRRLSSLNRRKQVWPKLP
jgi:hypothetical protein